MKPNLRVVIPAVLHPRDAARAAIKAHNEEQKPEPKPWIDTTPKGTRLDIDAILKKSEPKHADKSK